MIFGICWNLEYKLNWSLIQLLPFYLNYQIASMLVSLLYQSLYACILQDFLNLNSFYKTYKFVISVSQRPHVARYIQWWCSVHFGLEIIFSLRGINDIGFSWKNRALKCILVTTYIISVLQRRVYTNYIVVCLCTIQKVVYCSRIARCEWRSSNAHAHRT
jgi:hypothetical protein